jgi:UDP-N-acetylmuramyl pentapeptide phosphotransferase/UDP-N-acetylglucosamine-1-phosphate transferase
VLTFLAAVFAVAVVCSVAGGAVIRRLAPATGAVVPPRPDRWHTTPTPTMGGVAIAIATMAAFAITAVRPDLIGAPVDWGPVPLAAGARLGVCVLDDRLQLSPLG